MESKYQYPHRRWNPLRQSWVLVSPHRTQRPWQGEVGQKTVPSSVSYDPHCYLCPGNQRAGGATNPAYDGVFSFVNDYAALLPEPPAAPDAPTSPLLVAEPARGLCKVLCYHPDHSLTLARMTPQEIRAVVDAWTEQYLELGGLEWIKYVQIFENRGAMMGASNPHPHGQIWSTGFIPDEPAAETAAQRDHLARTGHCLLCDYLAAEHAAPADQGRIIFENEHFSALVPWWAIWPFEVLLVSRRHFGAMPQLTGEERDALADALHRLTVRFDNLFETSFPYTMGFHQTPTDWEGSGAPGDRSTVAGAADGEGSGVPDDGSTVAGVAEHAEWHFHAHFYPPLLRSATVRKFMVGFEMLGMPQRDITPEDAAQRLRACSEEHFWPRG